MEDNKQRFRWGICFLLLVFAFLSACSDETDLPGEQVDPLIEELQAIVDAKVGPDKLVGVSVSIRVGDNLIINSREACLQRENQSLLR